MTPLRTHLHHGPATRLGRRSLLRGALLGTGLAVGLAGGAVYANRVEPAWLDIRALHLTLPHLAPALHGYRVAHLSDLHLGDWLTRDRLAAIVRLVNQQQPDLIAITGDFVTRQPERVASDLVATLRLLRATDGVVAVLGNHDHWSDPNLMRQVLRESGIVELANDVWTAQRGEAQLHICGVDDVWVGQARLDRVLARLPAAGAALLLAHEPDFADISAASGRFDLQLSGHSHGGQVVLPFVGPLVLPPLARRYPLGRYQVGGMIQYTNRGVGMVAPLARTRFHVRFNCRPEITMLTLAAPGL